MERLTLTLNITVSIGEVCLLKNLGAHAANFRCTMYLQFVRLPTPAVNQILLCDVFHKDHPSHQVYVNLPTQLQPCCFDNQANFFPVFYIYLETDFRRLLHHTILLSHTSFCCFCLLSLLLLLPPTYVSLLKLLPALLASLILWLLFLDRSRWWNSVPAPFWCILHLHHISDTTGEGWEPQQPRETPSKIQVRLAEESHDIHI